MSGIYYLLVGVTIGVAFFCIFENAKPGTTFASDCWVRRQEDWIRHPKVYLVAFLLLMAASTGKCSLLRKSVFMLAGLWVGLHGAQDIAERIHESKNNLR